MRKLGVSIAAVAAILVAALLALRTLFGGGLRLEDRTAVPVFPGDVLERVTDLEYPPGNIAVSAQGRVFFTLHPDANPPAQVVELVDGHGKPYPDLRYQNSDSGPAAFQSVLSLRIDRLGRLWLLDYANYGRGQPRILAFDLATDRKVHQYDFPGDIAGLGSMLNDFQVDAQGRHIYIAETSPILQKPALIAYDTETRTSRRLLERDISVQSENLRIQAPGRDMIAFGFYTLRIPVDSIALDAEGEWLYYGAVTGSWLYRVRTTDLNDTSLTAAALSARVERFAPKTLSDGLTMDREGNIYLSDMEHSAILRLGQDRLLTTLVKDPRLRWPDGFSFGPDGWLYVTCSALQHVLFVGQDEVWKNAPYQIFRFRPGIEGFPGH
jgi:hypothetical protein